MRRSRAASRHDRSPRASGSAANVLIAASWRVRAAASSDHAFHARARLRLMTNEAARCIARSAASSSASSRAAAASAAAASAAAASAAAFSAAAASRAALDSRRSRSPSSS